MTRRLIPFVIPFSVLLAAWLMFCFYLGYAVSWPTDDAPAEQAVTDEALRIPLSDLRGTLVAPAQLGDKSSAPISEAIDAVAGCPPSKCDGPMSPPRSPAEIERDGISAQLAVFDAVFIPPARPVLSFGEAPLAGAFGLIVADLALPSGGTVGIMPPAHVSVLTPTREAPSVSHVPSAVPEPSVWAMMLAGFLSIGAMMRRKDKANGRPQVQV